MVRAIIILVSTMAFAAFGLLIGYLCVQVTLESGNLTYLADQVQISYLYAPLLGGVVGFVLSFITTKVFGQSKM